MVVSVLQVSQSKMLCCLRCLKYTQTNKQGAAGAFELPQLGRVPGMPSAQHGRTAVIVCPAWLQVYPACLAVNE